MSSAAWAAGVLCAALGLSLAFAKFTRAFWAGLALLLGTAVLVSTVEVDPAAGELAVSGCWVAVLGAAVCVHLPRGLMVPVALALCLSGGTLSGLAVAGAGRPADLLGALPWALASLPGAWLVAQGKGLVLKVVLSWFAAAAALSLGLLMTPTLGFEPDHMG